MPKAKPCPAHDPALGPFNHARDQCMGDAGHDGPHWIRIDRTWPQDTRPAWQRRGFVSEAVAIEYDEHKAAERRPPVASGRSPFDD
jgi:hypothetical protein